MSRRIVTLGAIALALLGAALPAQQQGPAGLRRAEASRAGPGVLASRSGTRGAGARGPVQCEKCHADRQFLVGKAKSERGDSVLFVPDTLLRDSRHATLVCADCHVGYNDGYPHVTVPVVAVPCQDCHDDQADAWKRSVHAPNFTEKGDAPTCVSCHSAHRVLGADDARSPTYPMNVARLCGSCHNSRRILEAYFTAPSDTSARTAVRDYRHSVHGLAMTRAGLVVSATCSDCHNAHAVLPRDSTASTLSRGNVAATCGACHAGVLATYDSSAHGQALVSGDTTDNGHAAPVCIECHGGHRAVSADDPVWFSGVVRECGTCHEKLLETYFETYHGKATELGYGIAAKCSDCHTAHAMLPADDPQSSVHQANLVETCGQCHRGANANFVQYRPHGDPHDREKDPELYWVWLFMTTLLVGVFAFFGMHTLLWLARVGVGGLRGRAPAAAEAPPSPAPGDIRSDTPSETPNETPSETPTDTKTDTSDELPKTDTGEDR
ncbi:MAG TPA: hypothetical protein VFT96_03260 [Gemmatimonadaceae bacterium]|nr:hypothetical protein [Gemmatimonadaceae bacterium]